MARPLKIEQLNLNIIPFEEEDDSELVGAAASVSRKGEVLHAALFTRFEGDSKVFHFTGEAVVYEDADSASRHFYKELLFIPSELVPSFVAHCELISENAKPIYGYFYSGSSLYDENGNFLDAGVLPESMTCVGFCLNVLKRYLGGNDLVAFQDWTHDTAPDDYIDGFYEKVKESRPTLTEEEFKRGVRRILPLEYFTASCSDEVNVSKSYIDNNSALVHQVMIDKTNA